MISFIFLLAKVPAATESVVEKVTIAEEVGRPLSSTGGRIVTGAGAGGGLLLLRACKIERGAAEAAAASRAGVPGTDFFAAAGAWLNWMS